METAQKKKKNIYIYIYIFLLKKIKPTNMYCTVFGEMATAVPIPVEKN